MAPFKLTHLQPGDRLRLIRGFTDFDGVAWAEGRTLEFVDFSYVPYDGGYTFTFREGTLRLAHLDAANDRLLRSLEVYFAGRARGVAQAGHRHLALSGPGWAASYDGHVHRCF